MQKHILDRPNSDRKAGLARALKSEAQKAPHPASITLQRRPRNENAAQRARHFWAIGKEKSA